MTVSCRVLFESAKLTLSAEEQAVLSELLFSPESTPIGEPGVVEPLLEMVARNKVRAQARAVTGRTIYGIDNLLAKCSVEAEGVVRGYSFRSGRFAGTVYLDGISDRVLGMSVVVQPTPLT